MLRLGYSRGVADPAKRAAWTEAATDYALENGLIGLSLRPLAVALGTSDRMLLYHFADKDDLVAEVLLTSSDRSVALISELPDAPDPTAAVLALWRAHQGSEQLHRCQRMYVEAAALGLFGKEPYASAVGQANARWMTALVGYLVRSGVPASVGERAAVLVDAVLMGLQLDEPLQSSELEESALRDLAGVVAQIASSGQR